MSAKKKDELTQEDQEHINRIFTEDLEYVYTVHAGTYQNEDKTQGGIANLICTRKSREEAEGIATLLNEALEGFKLLRWAATNCFPDIEGGRDELIDAVSDADVIKEWSDFEDALAKKRGLKDGRRAIFAVTEIKVDRVELEE